VSIFSEELDRAVVLDTETTGFDPPEAQLLEVAFVTGLVGYSSFVEYEGEIPPAAKAVHHIQEESVRPGAPNCYPRERVLEDVLEASKNSVVVFHNAAHDLKFLPELKDRPLVCTYRCALHVWPDAPDNKNQTLRYWKKAQPNALLIAGLEAHRALYDAAVTQAVLAEMLKERTLDQLVELTKKPVLLTTVRFGKYKGQNWTDVPRDYRAWMRRSGNWAEDVDVMHTLDVLDGRAVA
jgi:exodeoxyribonuclease X